MVEALLFASDAPLAAADLTRVDERLDEDTVAAVIDELRQSYDREERSFQVYEVAGGYQLLTRPEFVSVLERYETVPQTARLSNPALEVLAIIAYRQPIGRAEVEEIRGVGSSGVLRTLQDRGLIEPVGRAEGLGRPLLYGTTGSFLEHFGFDSLESLPRPEDLPVVLRERPATPEDQAHPEVAPVHASHHDHDPSPNPLPAHAQHTGSESAEAPTTRHGDARVEPAAPGEDAARAATDGAASPDTEPDRDDQERPAARHGGE
jgi:segregation and condensation protein B